ncbi:MAG: hypothetical protein AAGA62_17760, partial [Bacteroidota bacterium]
SPSPVELSIYGITDCELLRFNGNTCPELSGAEGWELITSFTVTGAPDSWTEVGVDFTPTQPYAALALGGSCGPVIEANQFSFWRNYYFIDEIRVNTQEAFEQPTVGPIQVFGDDICDGNANMVAEFYADATYQWYRNGVAILGATDQEYYPPLDANFPGAYSVLIDRPEGCGIAGPVDLIRPIVTNAFQDSVLLCDGGGATITPSFVGSLIDEFLWDDGSMQPTRFVTEPGTYSVTITSFCEENVETIEVVRDIDPVYEVVIEPEFICEGDEVRIYFQTNWQIDLVGFFPDGFLQTNIFLGDTLTFTADTATAMVVFDFGNCAGAMPDTFPLIPSQLIESVSAGILSCSNPSTEVVPTVSPSFSGYSFTWRDGNGNVLSNDS